MPRVWMVTWGLLGLVAGFAGGCLLVLQWPWKADWLEAVGTWIGALVAASAVILAVVAFRSEEFARRLDEARANRDERAKLQQEADLVMCSASWGLGNEVEPGIELVKELRVHAKNGSSYMVTDATCQIPQMGNVPIKLSAVLAPAEQAGPVAIPVPEPSFKVHTDNRELCERAQFTFTLGHIRWLAQYGQPAQRQAP